MRLPQPRSSILEMEPYKAGKRAIEGIACPIKLSSNESLLGASPKVRDALVRASETLSLYPDGDCEMLRERIAARHGIDAGRIVCGNGSFELLALLGLAYLDQGSEALYSEHGFSFYKLVAQTNGARPVSAPDIGMKADVDAILERVSPKTRIVFLANPNNPTGTYLTNKEVKKLHANLPPHVLLVLDGAYAEYVRREDYEAGIDLVDASQNVVMTRTFSKIYGLACLRLGWCYGPAHVADVLNRIRGPFNVSGAAQAAGVAAIADTSFEKMVVEHNEKWRVWLNKEITSLGLKTTEGAASFLVIHFDKNGQKTAAEADRFLQSKGLILRRLQAYKLPHCIRMTVGLEDANRAVVAALKAFMSR